MENMIRFILQIYFLKSALLTFLFKMHRVRMVDVVSSPMIMIISVILTT